MTRVLVLSAVLLLLFGGVSFAGVEVGGSGGAGTGWWARTSGPRGCATPPRITSEQGYHETAAFEGHVLVDVPIDAPRFRGSWGKGASRLRLGGAGGYLVTDEEWLSATFELAADTGTYSLASSSDVRIRQRRGWGGVRARFESPWVDVGGTLGAAVMRSSSLTPLVVDPVVMVQVRLGFPGVVGWSARGRWLSGLTAAQLDTESGMFSGVRVLGGDLPAFEIGVFVGPSERGATALGHLELGFDTPGHWRVQPFVRVRVDPTADRAPRWQGSLGVAVLIGSCERLHVRGPGIPQGERAQGNKFQKDPSP